MKLPPPVIVVPGITATYLNDEYPISPEVVWSVMTNNFDRIRLHPDQIRYEASQPVRVTAGQVFEVAYKELISELRHNLSAREDEPVPVYPFGYDWRQPLETTEASLADFVLEVIERTKLTRHYAKDGYDKSPTVNLVGHSMGGLIIAGYLANQKGKAPVSKVATLASPFRGSFEAVVKVLTGTADLGGTAPSSREREAARVMPALYHLMPTPQRGLTFAPGLPKSIFKPDVWQPSIIETVREYVRLYAVDPGRASDRIKQADDLFRSLLKTAANHREKLESVSLPDVGLAREDWLAVVGIGSVTRTQMRIDTDSKGKPLFVLSSRDRMNKWTPEAPPNGPDERYQTGDGTVPYDGAVPAFLGPENLVCLTPDDFGYWEVGDKMLAKVGGFHGILPNMNVVQRLIVRHFTGAPDKHENTWGKRAPGVAPADWSPPMELTDRTTQ
ncbi:MAG: alpha/beta hydrolase [Planctomycetes bacterium]|nr:alpha/beta hydrolase [Planctomycetota bacterium]